MRYNKRSIHQSPNSAALFALMKAISCSRSSLMGNRKYVRVSVLCFFCIILGASIGFRRSSTMISWSSLLQTSRNIGASATAMTIGSSRMKLRANNVTNDEEERDSTDPNVAIFIVYSYQQMIKRGANGHMVSSKNS